MNKVFQQSMICAFLLLLSLSIIHTTVSASTIKTKHFVLNNETSNISVNAPLCGYLTGGCTATISGIGKSNIFYNINYSANITVAWQNSKSNGLGGYCAPLAGSAIIKNSQKMTDSITITLLGTICDKKQENPLNNHKMTGTFQVSSGTGKYLLVNGSGIIKGYDSKNGRLHFFADGIVSYPLSDINHERIHHEPRENEADY